MYFRIFGSVVLMLVFDLGLRPAVTARCLEIVSQVLEAKLMRERHILSTVFPPAMQALVSDGRDKCRCKYPPRTHWGSPDTLVVGGHTDAE